jgi:hypothetical protein
MSIFAETRAVEQGGKPKPARQGAGLQIGQVFPWEHLSYNSVHTTMSEVTCLVIVSESPRSALNRSVTFINCHNMKVNELGPAFLIAL